jgi:serine/threonine protein kinase
MAGYPGSIPPVSRYTPQQIASSPEPSCLSEEGVLAYLNTDPRGDSAEATVRHVDCCGRCQTLIAEAVRGFTSTDRPAPAQVHTFQSGDLVGGRYQIVRFVGAGGMGEVYEARDRELGEVIAFKTLAANTLDDSRAVTRLKLEVLLARKATHRNVCRIFDLGVHRHERRGHPPELVPFLTMELLEGQTLARWLAERGKLAVPEARSIIEQVAAGLGAIHAAGIVHRDLKPSNIFLARDGGEGPPRVVVMDFGLARSARSSGPAASGVAGTVGYMAPEQVEGQPVAATADIYALGVILHQMLTGTQPGHAPTEGAFGAPWDRVIARALARSPGSRYPSVEAFLAALSGGESERPALAGELSSRFMMPILDLLEEKVDRTEVAGFLAGWRISARELRDQSIWLSLDFVESFCAWASDRVGTEAMVNHLSEETASPRAMGFIYPFLRAMGSPRSLYRRLPQFLSVVNKISLVRVHAMGRSYAELDYSPVSPRYRERTPLICHLRRAQLSAVPTIWGRPPAVIHEIHCQQRGADSCRYQLHWIQPSGWWPVPLAAVLGLVLGAALGPGMVPGLLGLAVGAALGAAWHGRRRMHELERLTEEQGRAIEEAAHLTVRRHQDRHL